jgi:hypothetical protein
MKSYFYRVTSPSNVTVEWGGSSAATLPVLSDPSFSKEVDSGLGQLIIEIAAPFDYAGTELTVGSAVQTFCSDDDGVVLIHSGMIETIEREIAEDGDHVSVTVSPWVKLLSQDYFKETAELTALSYHDFPVGTDISDILKLLIDRYRLNMGSFGRVHYTSSSIQTSGKTTSIEVGSATYLDEIRRIKKLGPGDWYWYVDENAVFSYRNFDSGTKHVFTMGKDTKSLRFTTDISSLKNTIYFWNGQDSHTTVVAFEYPQSQSASQALYGRRTEVVTDSHVDNADTGASICTNFLRENQDPIQTYELDIMDGDRRQHGYDIESIQPGDTCEIRNVPSLSGTVFSIGRVDYSPDSVHLTLGVGPVRRSRLLGMTIQEITAYMNKNTDGFLSDVPLITL